ncbi:MAG: ATP-binding protein [Patescibacteria group bacterium]
MNNWYVLTGAPCSGKTTLIEMLQEKGFQTTPELARVYIDEQLAKGITLEELRQDELAFQRKILQFKIDFEKKLDPQSIIFLDRGIPDSQAYYKLCGLENDPILAEAVRNSVYKKVFLFESWPLEKDYARTETPEGQIKLYKYLQEAYQKLNIPLIKVPVVHKTDKNNLPINWREKRLSYILDNL